MKFVKPLWLWFATAFRASPGLTLALCCTTVISSVLSPLTVLGVKLAVDAVTQHSSIWPGVLIVLVSLLASSLAGSIAGPIGDTVDERVWRYVKDDLLRLTGEVPSIAMHEHPELADRLSLLERDAHQLGGVYRMLGTLGAVTSTITVMSLLISVHPVLSLLLVLALVPAGISSVGNQRRHALWRKNERFRRVGTKVVDVLVDQRQGVEVRSFGLSDALLAVAGRALDARSRPWVVITKKYAWLTAAAWILFSVGYVLAGLWVFSRIGTGPATLGDMSLVVLIGPQVGTTAQAIAGNLTMVIDALAAFGRYQWLRSYAAANTWGESVAAPPDRLIQGIRFDHVDFAYPTGDQVTDDDEPPKLSLSDVNLDLPAGTTVAFVGENGAGKSTLVKLLARLYDPTHGAVLIDGVPLSDLDPRAWRERISAGFQDFASLEFLATDSIGVGALDDRTDRQRVDAAVTAGQAEPVVDSLGSGLDTQLGTRFKAGVGLSGGQWQRIALARAFMRTRPLLMLLDEPTAALDPEAEQAIYQQYGETARELASTTGAVTVLVSHRFSTVRMADLIVVVADGGIAEIGSHEDLLLAGGRYAELFELQARAYR